MKINKKAGLLRRNPNWYRAETLDALNLYPRPFGQLHRNQPKIKELTSWIGRTANSVALKLVNLASLDPQIIASGRSGMGQASNLDKALWQELLAIETASLLKPQRSKKSWRPGPSP